MTKEQIELKILNGEIESLHQLLGLLPKNVYSNLHNILNISKTKLTQLLNNPKEKGDIQTANEISRLLEINPIILVMGLKFGYPNITLEEMENLGFEFEHGFQKAS